MPQAGTRPTSERAREALFNTVGSIIDVDGATVLDLFAGSGGVGLEALSLGAAAVVLVERDRRACEVIEANVAVVGLPGAVVKCQGAAEYLARSQHEPFDLVFADPPYALDAAELADLLTLAVKREILAVDGLIVIERGARDAELVWPPGVVELKRRRYSEAVLWYGRREQIPV